MTAKGEEGFRAGVLRVSDLDYVYESAFLTVVSAFEQFLEELFYSCLLGNADIANVTPTASIASRPQAERLLLSAEGKAGYVTWMPIDRTLDRSRQWLLSGRPFSRLERHEADLTVLNEATVIRNAIAHDSGTARTKFAKLVGGSLPSNRRRPGPYLRLSVGNDSAFEVRCDDLLRVGSALSARTESKGLKLLLAEKPYNSGKPSPAGSYDCVRCHTRIRKASTAKMPDCGVCAPQQCSACGRGQPSQFRRVRS